MTGDPIEGQNSGNSLQDSNRPVNAKRPFSMPLPQNGNIVINGAAGMNPSNRAEGNIYVGGSNNQFGPGNMYVQGPCFINPCLNQGVRNRLCLCVLLTQEFYLYSTF